MIPLQGALAPQSLVSFGNATGKGGKKGTTVPGTTTEEVTMDKKEGKNG